MKVSRLQSIVKNPETAGADWPAVVVAGAYQTGLVLMRNLERRGLRVFGFDCNPDQPGFRSVYGKTELCPNPDRYPADWLAFMADLSRRIGGKPVLIPSADQFVSAIAAHSAALIPLFTFHSSAAATQALLATKERQYDIAAQNGLPTARTQFIQGPQDIKHFAASAHFPCLIKPPHCREWEVLPPGHPLLNQKLAIAESPVDLEAQYASVASVTPQVVAQEIIQGPDTAKLCYMGVYSRGGVRLGSCVVRQIRTDPIGFGSASVVEPVIDPEAESLSDNFLRAIGYAGLCELELKRDSRDGRLKLIEANPRYSVTSDSTPPAGVDLGWIHYLDLIGYDVQPVRQQPADYRHIVLMRDVATVRSYRRAGLLPLAELIRSYRPPVYFFDFDLRDRRVTKKTVVELIKIALYPYWRRLRRRR
jgi:D-aspartate ligase